MIKRTCLLIDDERQDLHFPIIMEEGRKYNLEIECLQFNVGNQERRDLLDENEEISFEKVVTVFKKEFNAKKIDLIGFDWNIGSGIKGPELIKLFNDNEIRRKVPKILYSGALKDEFEMLLLKYREDKSMSFKIVWNQFYALLTTDVLAFAGKQSDYEKDIVQQLRKVEDTFENTIEEELRKFPDFIFKSIFTSKNFKNKKFSEIAEIIEKDKNLKNDFTKEIVQQVIAYLTEKI